VRQREYAGNVQLTILVSGLEIIDYTERTKLYIWTRCIFRRFLCCGGVGGSVKYCISDSALV